MVDIEFDPECDLSFVEIFYELHVLGEYREVLENQVVFLRDQKNVRFEQWANRVKPDNDEYRMLCREHLDTIERTYPRYLRYPFIISLWAVFELALKETSEYIASNKGVKLKLNDIKGSNIIEQSRKYFDNVLMFELQLTASIDSLYLVRNLIAHANGILEFSKKGRKKKLEGIIEQNDGLSIESGVLMIEESYLRDSYKEIDGAISNLIDRIRKQWKTKKCSDIRQNNKK